MDSKETACDIASGISCIPDTESGRKFETEYHLAFHHVVNDYLSGRTHSEARAQTGNWYQKPGRKKKRQSRSPAAIVQPSAFRKAEISAMTFAMGGASASFRVCAAFTLSSIAFIWLSMYSEKDLFGLRSLLEGSVLL